MLNFMKYFLLHLILFSCFFFQAYSQTSLWNETQPAGNNDKTWRTASMTAGGNVMLAAVSGGRIYVTLNGGTTWNETTDFPPHGTAGNWAWETSAVNSGGTEPGRTMIAGIYGGRLYMTDNYAQWWWEAMPEGSHDKNWRTVAMSADGNKVIAGIDGGRLYLSNDKGVTWNEIQPAGAHNKNWAVTSMTPDGSVIVAGVYGGRLYISLNGGSTWSETTDFPGGVGDKNWVSAAISSNGYCVLAAVDGGRLYYTFNQAAWWEETMPEGSANKSWRTVAISADGSKLTAGIYGGKVYYSDDAVVHWEEIQPAGNNNKNWQTLSMSADGSKIFAGVYQGRLYYNSQPLPVMLSWHEIQPAGNSDKNWHTASVSKDGNTIVAGVWGGRLYVSRDGGTNWHEKQPQGNSDYDWCSSAISDDGSKIIASYYSGTGSTGLLFYSSNYGDNWINTAIDAASSSEYGFWYPRAIAVNNDASIILGSSPNKYNQGIPSCCGVILISRNSGSQWTQIFPLNQSYMKNWITASMNSSGSVMIAGETTNDNGGRLLYSTNSGNSWIETRPAGNNDKKWNTTSMDVSGSKIIAGIYGGRLYYSINTGASWAEIRPAGDVDKNWYSTSLSSDGNTVIAGVDGGRLYYSTDTGNNWYETQPAGSNDKKWQVSAMNSDGSKIIAGVYGGRLYINDRPLPVKLASFTAAARSNTVSLLWKTLSELNNSGFEIERKNPESGWVKLGFIQGRGTVNTPSEYSYEDKNLPAGRYQYRIRQIDHNGNFEYHELSGGVEIGVPLKFSLSRNYPNPFNPSTKIDFSLPVESRVSLIVYDIAGREVARLLNNEFRKADYHSVEFNAGTLPSGAYFYRLSAGSFTAAGKMICIK